MPYACAKAVCATFCCHIAGALIPIFGPDFPAACLPPQSPEYGRMVIAKALVQEATRDTQLMRQIALRESSTAAARPLPFHRRQSLDPLDRYDCRGAPAQRAQGAPRLDTRYHEAYDRGHHLPPPAMPSSYHAHARSEPLHAAAFECGPELAPIKYYSSHRGALLPSPIEHERLPPFSHIASLMPTTHQQPERGSTTLPPLIVRDDYRHYYQHASLYEDASRYHGRGALHWANASDASGHAKQQTGWMPRESLGSPPTDYPERPYSWVEHDPVGDSAAAAAGYSSDAMEEEQSHDGRFASSSCYPSPPRLPPRLPPLMPYESEPLWKRPSHYASRYAGSDEADRARDKKDHRKSVSTSALPPQCRKHKTSTGGRRRSLKNGNSAMPWNAKDANAAELLVKLGSKGPGQGQGDYEERIRDSISVKTSCSPKLQQLQTQTQARKLTGQRFAASISSLLCDDAAPRKKRRGV